MIRNSEGINPREKAKIKNKKERQRKKRNTERNKERTLEREGQRKREREEVRELLNGKTIKKERQFGNYTERERQSKRQNNGRGIKTKSERLAPGEERVEWEKDERLTRKTK